MTETMLNSGFDRLVEVTWDKLGYKPSQSNPLFDVAEDIWRDVRESNANDPDEMPVFCVLEQTLLHFFRFALTKQEKLND